MQGFFYVELQTLRTNFCAALPRKVGEVASAQVREERKGARGCGPCVLLYIIVGGAGWRSGPLFVIFSGRASGQRVEAQHSPVG